MVGLDPMGQAPHQRHARLLLQQPQPAAGSGQRDMDALRRLGEAAGLADGHEQAQGLKIMMQHG